MSEITKAALDEAVRAHIADEHDDSLAASWVLIAERVPLDGDDGHSHVVDVVPDGQSAVTTMGLAYFLAQRRSVGSITDD
ncbi:hypothetical protein ACF07D_07375 [Leucobacter sp. NPDC015123]|uniref:hypothetical protein n=1 Tax=Leucobacter sp. NPDC015123 TaxID=3364129 RepID=UPI0036F491BD